MRTTLNIDSDVLLAAKTIAQREGKSTGLVMSRLARAGLAGNTTTLMNESKALYGFRPFPKEGRVVSNDLINRLREAGEY